jgi:hypothetical protein
MVNYFPLFLVAQKTIITNLQQFRLTYYLSQNYLTPLFILFSLVSSLLLYISYALALQPVRTLTTASIIHLENDADITKTFGNEITIRT